VATSLADFPEYLSAEQNTLPLGIVKFLEKRNEIAPPNIQNRYWVSDIVSCQRKIYYKRLQIEEEVLEDVTIEGMWGKVRGEFLHDLTYAYKWRELDVEHYIPLKDGRMVTLVGRLDMYDWKEKKIIDLKTTKSIKWQIKQGFIPKREHILQILCYNTIFSKIIPIENLNIVYADMTDIVAYKIKKRDLAEWIKSRIEEIEESLSSKRIPDGEASGVCKYCKYQTICHHDGNGLIERPHSIPKMPKFANSHNIPSDSRGNTYS
jgi:CRISPR/Cas system-associated exonuclease Cas4 (RecB family)